MPIGLMTIVKMPPILLIIPITMFILSIGFLCLLGDNSRVILICLNIMESLVSKLNKTLTLYSGTTLFLNIVIGAGLLVIPGLVYQQVADTALLSWLICALVGLVILCVFVVLGRNYPDAGGISHYAYKAFGSFMQRVSAYLLLGAVVLGLPSIAMTGGYYLDSVFSLPSSLPSSMSSFLPFAFSFHGSVHLYAVAIVLLSAVLHLSAGQSVSKVLGVIGSGVIIVLLVLLAISLMGLDFSNATKPIELIGKVDYQSALMPFMMIFFAFTGWGIAAHSAEEFVDSQRDFPLAMVASFVIATVFYLAIAWVVQQSSLSSHFESPFLLLTKPVLGDKGVYLVAMVAVLIIFANIFGAVWGISRLLYSLGQNKILPSVITVTDKGVPKRAIIVVSLALLLTISLDYLQVLNIKSMLALAGQNFLILYGIASACLFVLTNSFRLKGLAIAVLLLVLILLYVAGVNVFYPMGLIGLAVVGHWWQK